MLASLIKFTSTNQINPLKMLPSKAAMSLPSALRAECSRQLPASSVAISRFISMGRPLQSPPRRHFLTYTRKPHPTSSWLPTVSIPPMNGRWLSSSPICDHIDCSIAKDISVEDFDNAYKFVYHQHNHPHGPWLKTLQAAQKLVQSHSPRILCIGSGPGEPAATLAANFEDAEVISAHSTTKCVEWASQRFHKHDLHNATTRLVPSMEDLSVFADGSFDLVASCYGLANTENPDEALNEIHRVLKPGGSFLCSVWESAGADPASDIILRHSCVGPNPWHKDDKNRDVVGNYACPVRSKRPMSLSKPHLLENMLETANLPCMEVAYNEYPLKLGKTKEFAFKSLTLPIRAELQALEKNNHYHFADAAEAFEDVLKEGFMVKMHEDGEMEVPYNVYKFVVARRQFEDGDMAKQSEAMQKCPASIVAKKSMAMKPIDVKEDPVIFDTWNRMKGAASAKLVEAVKKQIGCYKESVRILDAAPTRFANTSIDIALGHPYAAVVATSLSVNVVESIREEVVKHGVSNVKVKAMDASHMTTFPDNSFDVVLCSFGLAFLHSPEGTLKEYYRLLKPGGSLIVSVWEDFSLKNLSDFIVEEMHAAGSLEDFIDLDSSSPGVLSQLTPYAKPHELEKLVTECGFNVSHVDHETARIILSESSRKSDFGLDVATLPIRPFLQELEKNGENKTAFEDARRAFQSLLRDPSLVSRDSCGNLVTTLPSRFKIVTAIREHTDQDGFLDKKDSTAKDSGRKTIHVSDIPK